MTPKLKALVRTLATGIARHATLTKPFDTDGVASPLDPNYLEAQANAEFVGAAVDVGNIAASDMRALQHLRVLARDGAETEAARAVLGNKESVEALKRVLAAPPPELGPRAPGGRRRQPRPAQRRAARRPPRADRGALQARDALAQHARERGVERGKRGDQAAEGVFVGEHAAPSSVPRTLVS